MDREPHEKTEIYETELKTQDKKPFIVIIQGKELGKVHPISCPCTIGRSNGCDIRLMHPSVSRVHARITFDHGYYIEDDNSTNGVYIENKKIDGREAIQNGDIIRIGSQIIKFSLNTSSELVYHEEIYDMATKDPLTHLYNRRYFMDTGSSNIERSFRNKQKVCLATFDIDFFKRVNDSFGHAFGDTVLKDFAMALARFTRETDLAARIGGEEFAVLFFGASLKQVIAICKSILQYQKEKIYSVKDETFQVTVSAGVCALNQRSDSELSIDRLMAIADEALYQAKTQGRDQVVAI
ncbi:GGDEF domain-containing protein [Pleionea sediminis]|uniref:GGDEF domain-containing protein n=1 Tax=Pleionea sediminis TaxID=2569479 RepID=UPI0011858F14|nr:GGDEF domain-containing protein [Pleionea sediminis]